jgi:threonine synthase
MNLLVATTGDTGPAAVQAVSDVANPLLTLLVHYPEGQISNFQERQLTTVPSPCVKVVAFAGSGDDMDLPIKNIIRDPDRTTLVTGVNSYNIGRPLMQCVHYVWTYLRVAEALGLERDKDTPPVILDVVLPTGAMGNLVAGYMCKQMGLPLGKLSAGVNANDITYRVVQTGAFHRADTMHKTLSDAINIQVPYNFERLLFYLTGGGQQGLVKEWMQQMEETNQLDLPTEWLRKLQTDFAAARVPDDSMCARLQTVWQDYQYLADPHTAVALDAAHQLGYTSATSTPTTPVAILATASPCKFEESVTAAVGNQVWQQYVQGDFPPAAKTILERAQVPPVHYAARESLEESQVAWEKQAREILEELQQL